MTRILISIFVVIAMSHAALGNEPQPILKAKALQPGDTIAIIAPAKPLQREAIMLAKERLEAMGFKVKIPDNLFRTHGYLAGTDEERADELMDAFTDKEVDAIFSGGGGYGATRILDRLDFDKIRANPKILTGYSDITALHVAIHQKTGLITFHTPVASYGLGTKGGLTPFAERTFWRALLAKNYEAPNFAYTLQLEESDKVEQKPLTLVPGQAEGRLIGGNLSLLHALMGTPYEVETAGNILFIEDVGEAPYRVDRMLQTLKSAGLLDPVSGVVLGAFTRRADENTSSEVVTMEEVLRDFFQDAPYPVLMRFPVGHQPDNCTMPEGVNVRLDADAGVIQLLEAPVQVER